MRQVDLHEFRAPIKAAIARQSRPYGSVERMPAAGSRISSFTSLLRADLGALLANDPGIAMVRPEPETFCWRDGADGRRCRYNPAFLTVSGTGMKVYREVKPYGLLMRDPEFSGRRARIELECAARGATFEIWTEREIREDRGGWPLLRVATTSESLLYRHAEESGASSEERHVPPIARHVADRLGLTRPERAGNSFLARSHLTGVLMAVLCDLVEDPHTGALSWKPAPRPALVTRSSSNDRTGP